MPHLYGIEKGKIDNIKIYWYNIPVEKKKEGICMLDRYINAERKLQLIYWLVENLKTNEKDEALLTTFNLIQNFCDTEEGMYKTLIDNWDKVEEEELEETEQLLPLHYGNMNR